MNLPVKLSDSPEIAREQSVDPWDSHTRGDRAELPLIHLSIHISIYPSAHPQILLMHPGIHLHNQTYPTFILTCGRHSKAVLVFRSSAFEQQRPGRLINENEE